MISSIRKAIFFIAAFSITLTAAAAAAAAQAKLETAALDPVRPLGAAAVPVERLVSSPSVESAPQIDGRLDDRCWSEATAASGFFVRLSNRSRSFSVPSYWNSRAFICHDEKNLYVAFECSDFQMERLVCNQLEHDDPVWLDDCVQVIIDPDADRQNYYAFMLNSSGVRFESCGHDYLWDAHWQGAAAKSDQGWSAELAVPWESLGRGAGGEIGLNLIRVVPGREGKSSWLGGTECGLYGPATFAGVILGGPSVLVAGEELKDLRFGANSKSLVLDNPGLKPLDLDLELQVIAPAGREEKAVHKRTVSLPSGKRGVEVPLGIEFKTPGLHRVNLKLIDPTLNRLVWSKSMSVRIEAARFTPDFYQVYDRDRAFRAQARVVSHKPEEFGLELTVTGPGGYSAAYGIKSFQKELADISIPTAGLTPGDYRIEGRFTRLGREVEKVSESFTVVRPYTQRHLSAYFGRAPRVDDPITRLGMERSRDVTIASTGGFNTADTQMILGQMRLCPQSAKYIYDNFTRLKIDYRKGGRQELEKIVAEITGGKTGDLEQGLAVWRFCTDMALGHQARPVSYDGGSEEEIIERHSSICNEQARAMIIMAQIAGIPARYVGHYSAYDSNMDYHLGHGVCELYLEGRWVYFDIRGKRYFRDDGRPASVWDILRDPLLLTRQGRRLPEEVYSGFLGDGNRYGVYGNWHYFQGSTMTVVNNYYVDDMAGWKMKAALVTDEIISTMGRVSAEKASQAEPHFRKFWE